MTTESKPAVTYSIRNVCVSWVSGETDEDGIMYEHVERPETKIVFPCESETLARTISLEKLSDIAEQIVSTETPDIRS